MACYRTDDQVRSYDKMCDCSKRVQRQNRNRIKKNMKKKIWLLRKSDILLKVESIFLLVDFIDLYIGDSRYCKNLFREANRDILDFVQQVYGDVLPRDKTLPQLVCRSCERKVKNAATVKKTSAETQRLLVEKESRAKRRTAQKFSARTSLSFHETTATCGAYIK